MLETTLSQICTFRWRGHLLSESSLAGAPEVDLGHRDLTELIIHLHPQLSWVEFAQLINRFQNHPAFAGELSPERLGGHYGYGTNQRAYQFFNLLSHLPSPYLEWCKTRKVGPKDLAPLLALPEVQKISPLLLTIAESLLSRNDGKQILDWLVDLWLMGKTVEELLPSPLTDWGQHLYQLRFPQTTLSEGRPSGVEWPSYCQHQYKRNGDRREQVLSIRFLDDHDLQQKLQSLLDKMEG